MEAEGAQAESLLWIDTDNGDAGRPNYRSGLVVREIKKPLKKSDVPSAAELFSGMPPLESVKALLSLFVSHSQEEAIGKRTTAMLRPQPWALAWSTTAKSVCRTPR